MSKTNKEEVDTLNKASLAKSSEMQKETFDVVTKQNRAQREQEEKDKAARSMHHKDSIKTHKYEENVKQAKHLTAKMKDTITTFDSLLTILFAISAQAKVLCDVAKYRIEAEIKEKVTKVIGSNYGQHGINVREHLTHLGSDLFKQIVQGVKDNVTDPDVFMPGIIHFIELDKDSKLKIAPLKFNSSIVVSPKQNDIFNKDFKIWLDQNGYKEDPKSGQVINKKTGDVIDKKTFEELRDGPNGLTRYLQKQWKMKNVLQERARVDAPKEEPKVAPKKKAKEDAPEDDAENNAEEAPEARGPRRR